MKIVVVTPFDSANFGAYLQAYCLKYFLESKGHEVVHIPTRSYEYVRNLYYRDKPVSKRDKLFIKEFKERNAFGRKKWELFVEAQKHFKIDNSGSTNADLFILGSDEIWNVRQAAFRRDVFWGIDLSPVISYAASIGSSTPEEIKMYPEQINAVRNLSKVLVRDMRTKEFVENVCSVEASIVCDPTLLVSVGEYGDTYSDEFVKNNDCLLIYSYSLTKKEITSIKEFAAANGLKTVSCCFYHKWCDHVCHCSPLQFSDLIRQCKAVVTTTFHGSIFSIVNHMKFISITSNPKTVQLLREVELDDHLINPDEVDCKKLQDIYRLDIDYKHIEDLISISRRKSSDCLEQAIYDAVCQQRKFNYQICRSDDCTGCFACMNKCPQNAISVINDKVGRTVPLIDIKKCVRCGLCKKVCPVNNPPKLVEPLSCFAAQISNEKERLLSSSGGISAALTEYFVTNGGVAYGSVATKGGYVKHQRADNIEEAKKFRGSKYVQSYIGFAYRSVLKDLKSGKMVLFTGTPCQIAGLYGFLGKDYDNLFTIDIICHGVPPMQYLKKHIESISDSDDITSLSFRGGKTDYIFKLYSDNQVIYDASRFEDTYYWAFMKMLTFRENCYTCRYAGRLRVGDITLGDFWGIKKDTLKQEMNGRISAIIVNSNKGLKLLEFIKDRIIIEPRNYDEAVQGNAQLRNPSTKHIGRQAFITSYEQTGDIVIAMKRAGINKQILNYKLRMTLPVRVLRKVKNVIFREKRKT